jgi:hypothetical protein
MERYQPNGTPLTDYEREALVILMEECAEVIQAASKLIRFGKENRPDTGEANSVVLAHEIGDLEATCTMVVNNTDMLHLTDIYNGRERKRSRLAHFMQTSRSG